MKTRKTSYLILGLLVITLTLFITGAFLFQEFKNFRGKQQNLSFNQKNEFQKNQSFENNQQQQEEVKAEKPLVKVDPVEVRLNMLFFGDVFWGRYVDDWSKASELKTQYPFSGLSSFQRENYNAWIANLECPITSTYLSSEVQERLLKFSCMPEYTVEAAKWFSVFSLSNNHTDNMQEVDGLSQTKKNLQQNKIQFFGHYDNAVKEDLCEVVSLEISLRYANDLQSVDETNKSKSTKPKLPVVFCGFHNVFKLPLQDELGEISKFSKYFPVFVMPHQGAEYLVQADSLQTQYYRSMIDLGADAVIGGHTHSVQNTEAYKGKLIVYSLGNFIFDQQFSNIVTSGIAIDADMYFSYDDNLEKHLEMAKWCGVYKDICLARAEKENLKKPNFSIKYNLIATDNSNRLAKKGNENLQNQMLIRTNWERTLANLAPL